MADCTLPPASERILVHFQNVIDNLEISIRNLNNKAKNLREEQNQEEWKKTLALITEMQLKKKNKEEQRDEILQHKNEPFEFLHRVFWIDYKNYIKTFSEKITEERLRQILSQKENQTLSEEDFKQVINNKTEELKEQRRGTDKRFSENSILLDTKRLFDKYYRTEAVSIPLYTPQEYNNFSNLLFTYSEIFNINNYSIADDLTDKQENIIKNNCSFL